MSDPLPLGKEMFKEWKNSFKQAINGNSILVAAVFLSVIALIAHVVSLESAFYAQAAQPQDALVANKLELPIFGEQLDIFEVKDGENKPFYLKKRSKQLSAENEQLAAKIYEIVGETPIREMVPYISLRDPKVAAFLVGIAKKESSFGLASPLKDGQTCYNYWGYKGAGGRGTGMGYACFASAEEAVQTVGNRIEVLISKNRTTPARMVDTWKCGTSCKGDPNAPSWVSTVALYFEKIVG